MSSLIIRPAKTNDVVTIRKLIDTYAPERILLSKATVTLYEAVPDFLVIEKDGKVIGAGAVHVLWEDLAEVRTVAVFPEYKKQGIGSQLLEALIEKAKVLGVKRLFCLTFELKFFTKHGFTEIQGTPVEPEIYQQLLESYDVGIAEFLDLDKVKPNTLGNTRMIKHL
ncbi:MAG: amino-acid N-acetyltransferase [Actinomycetota bacterium]|nr:amino-acid N-acetyltransferase [Actinomycetota bacterium]MDA3026843.1 amino-acid N-acetyltransferase [Actinomycetota bacterium]